MSFRNPIVAGNTLVRAAIESANYSPGLAGWIIQRNGNAEFNSLTLRGTFMGTDYEINSAGLFFYSGTPAAGNLITSLAGFSGTDAFGNAYPQGLSIHESGKSIVAGLTGGAPLLYFVSGLLAISNGAAFQDIVLGSGTAQFDLLQLIGAEDSTQLDLMLSTWSSSSADGTNKAQATTQYKDPSGGFHTYAAADYTGFHVNAGSMVAVDPTTGTARATPAAAESWHNATITSALWTVTGAATPARYRLEPQGSGGGCVRLSGEVITTGAGPWPANGTIFTLPSGYHPSHGAPFITRSDISVSATQETVNVLATGSIQNGQGFTAANQRLYLDGIVFPLD